MKGDGRDGEMRGLRGAAVFFNGGLDPASIRARYIFLSFVLTLGLYRATAHISKNTFCSPCQWCVIACEGENGVHVPAGESSAPLDLTHVFGEQSVIALVEMVDEIEKDVLLALK